MRGSKDELLNRAKGYVVDGDRVCDSGKRNDYDVFGREYVMEVISGGMDLSASGYIQHGSCSFRKNVHLRRLTRARTRSIQAFNVYAGGVRVA